MCHGPEMGEESREGGGVEGVSLRSTAYPIVQLHQYCGYWELREK